MGCGAPDQRDTAASESPGDGVVGEAGSTGCTSRRRSAFARHVDFWREKVSLTAADVAEIMRLVEQSNFDELTLEIDGIKLSLRRGALAEPPLTGAADRATAGSPLTGAAHTAAGTAGPSP